MKKTILSVGMGLMALALLPSCGGGDNNASEKGGAKKETTSKNTTPAVPPAPVNPESSSNFRFIDSEALKEYNLAKDFDEQMINMNRNIEEEEKKQRSALQTRANSLQTKMQSAQSQAEVDKLKSEYESIQNQSAQAEQKLGQMAADMEKTLQSNAKTLQDSIKNFLRDYASQKGYDAIIVSDAAPYYNPSLDVTEEVIEGLNARYNKVKKK